MAKLAPMSVAALDAKVAALNPSVRKDLRKLHTMLIRATPLADEIPTAVLAKVAQLIDEIPRDVGDGLPPRSRTVFRLIRAGAFDAAWAVLIDNATGLVKEPFHASTSSGASRKTWRLPLLSRIEPPTVFADLPGFRDPRYGVPDDCYDITDVIRLRHYLDEVIIEDTVATLGGWAVLDPLVATANDLVRLFVEKGDSRFSVAGRRLHRADLVDGKTEPRDLRVWAGWSASLDLADPRLVPGTWTLSLKVAQNGFSRREPLAKASDLARAGTKVVTRVAGRSVRWKTGGGERRLVVTAG